MGIKGIYGEIGGGERIALSKLAIEKFEQTRRPFRIAIDISIWQFQIQAGQGGSNPAIRTLYYRLLRLLSISVQPLFVFDGPHKPPFKRNQKTGHHGAMLPNLLTKQLLKLFGFPFHVAPGEAEAECALLQREGLVDAVLSEDVDTLMFGCGLTLRNWSSEGTRGNKSPTHVSVYDAVKTKNGKSGLDREGMVLIALMSGGDYITEGIPGCGIKVASEAARAGFGKSLCRISKSDAAGLEAWRNNLAHEVQSNESRFFRCKHKTLKIPAEFPNREVLSYYTHPVVSSASKMQSLQADIKWDGEVDVPGLRLYVAEAFDWSSKIGAIKFIRGLAPALLVHKLRIRGDRRDSGYGDVILTAMNEMQLVRAICGKRTHISSDGIPEMRVIYHPMDIVDINLDDEPDDSGDYGRDGLAPVDENDQIEAYQSDERTARARSTSPQKRGPSVYDPTQPDKAWLPETIAKVGIPLKVEDYEESLRNPRKFIKQKAAAKRAEKKGDMPKGAMDKFVSVSKPGKEAPPSAPSKSAPASSQALPPVYLAPTLERLTSSAPAPSKQPVRVSRSITTTKSKPSVSRLRTKGVPKEKPTPNANPWTLSQGDHSSTSAITKPSSHPSTNTKQTQFFDLSSSSLPSSPLPGHLTPQKHRHSPSPSPERCLRTPLSRARDSSKPAPHKKHSPEPTTPLSPELPSVNRRLDFTPPAAQPREATSSSPGNEFPSVAEMLSPTPKASRSVQSKQIITIDSSPPVPRSMAPSFPSKQSTLDMLPRDKVIGKAKEGKKYIMLRDSLPGGWQLFDEEGEAERSKKGKGGKKWRMSEVGVLDLTED
ncbi:Flap endonuclease GEN-like protein [Lachnellula occidentalis]|uniref:Flap endonuclease GEN-like protein n=1 Tax=Lachnellula occidentalis TaxID=215460 RepID=A0A8H8S4F1_9HELO|nr:Flap endonuclease GEN-like protein [Lachnellula occidentalis]